MRRFIHQSCRFALLGLFTTIAVSWVCAVLIEVTQASPEQARSSDGPSQWLVNRYNRRGAERVLWMPVFSTDWDTNPPHDRIPLFESTQRMRRSLARSLKSRSDLIPPWSGVGDRHPEAMFVGNRDLYDDLTIEDARGWPWLALRCEFGPQLVNGLQVRREVRGGVPLPSFLLGKKLKGLEAKALPITPIWLGLIGDSVVYGAAWMAVLRLPANWVRLIRRIRRRCPGCGYDVQGLSEQRCPECGQALRRTV